LTKTVQQVVDEYLERKNNGKYSTVEIEKETGKGETARWTYVNVTNIYKDGIKIDEFDLDDLFHKYEFYSAEKVSIFDNNWPIKHTHFTIKGKVIEFTKIIKE